MPALQGPHKSYVFILPGQIIGCVFAYKKLRFNALQCDHRKSFLLAVIRKREAVWRFSFSLSAPICETNRALWYEPQSVPIRSTDRIITRNILYRSLLVYLKTAPYIIGYKSDIGHSGIKGYHISVHIVVPCRSQLVFLRPGYRDRFSVG